MQFLDSFEFPVNCYRLSYERKVRNNVQDVQTKTDAFIRFTYQ